MKKSLMFPLFLLLFTCDVPLSDYSLAQEGSGGGDSGVEAITIETERFDVDFVDTPAREAFDYISMVLESIDFEPLNIVYGRETENIILPSMRLRQITFPQFVSFINRIGGARFVEAQGADDFGGGGGGGFSSVAAEFPPHSGPRFGISEEEGIWYFWAEKLDSSEVNPDANRNGGMMGMAEEGGAAEAVLETTVFALDGETEIILGLIEEAFGETRRYTERPEPSLKFHEPSSTLIVTATMEDLRMVEKVIQVVNSRLEQEQRREAELSSSRLAQENKTLRETLSKLQDAEPARKKSTQAAEEKVESLQRDLDVARDSYKDDHPAILNLKKQLARALEELKDAE